MYPVNAERYTKLVKSPNGSEQILLDVSAASGRNALGILLVFIIMLAIGAAAIYTHIKERRKAMKTISDTNPLKHYQGSAPAAAKFL